MRRRRNDTKRLVSCVAAILMVALVIGLSVYFLLADPSPAKKLMKEHPYSFVSGKVLGTEEQDSYVYEEGCVYLAYPKLKNEATDQVVEEFVATAKEAFDTYLAENTVEDEEEIRIPRLIVDYKTEQSENYGGLRLFYEIGEYDENGAGEIEQQGERNLYLDSENNILDLDGVLGENSQKKIDLMLKAGGRSTADLQDFAISGDDLILRWAEDETTLSVKAVERASLIDPDKPMIALTFDDGPGKYSRQFADLLAEYNGHGTFFVLGMNVPNFAESLKYVYEMGNEVASHTMRHKNLNAQTTATVKAELDEAAEAIYEAIGAYPILVRTPYGNANDTVMEIIDGPMIKWSVDTLDWKSRNAQAVKESLLNDVEDGDIVLMHEIYESSLEGLRLALGELADRGYQFVTVSELMQYRGVAAEQEIYYSCYPD